MVRKAQKKKRVAGRSFGKAALTVGGRMLLRALRHAGPLLLVFGIAGWGAVWLWQDARGSGQYRLLPTTAARRDDLPPSAREELARLGREAGGRSLLDPGAVASLEALYAASPWVAQTFSFRRDLDQRVIVADVMLRLPTAQVFHRGLYYSVDEEGVLLPLAARNAPRDGLPIIHTPMPKTPDPGECWRNPALQDALAVLQLVWAEEFETMAITQVVATPGHFVDMDLRSHRQRPRLDLHTRSGAVIRWGAHVPRQGATGEPSNAEKLLMLHRILGQVEALRRHDLVDVRTKSPTYLMGAAPSRD